jgi:Zn-dependent M28 family amino/carboxypeptidase
VIVSLVGLLIAWVCQIVLCNEYANWFAISQMFWLPFYGALLFFTNWNRIVQGANDNLTGCMAAIGVAKYLSDNGIRFEHTEVRIITSGCEESGLRGAKAYARQHPPDAIETAFIAFDTIRDIDQMRIYNRDMTATVALDQRVCNIMQKGGQLAGLNLDFGWIFFGSTDAAAAQQAGYPSGSFVAMEMTPADFYHTRRDNIENLDPYVIGHAIDLAIGSTLIFDQQGLEGGANTTLD